MIYKQRIAEERLDRLINLFPSVAVLGPRQSGKSTMLKNHLPGYRYISFDDPGQRAFLEDDPRGFIRSLGDSVILDEIQKVPAIFDYIKLEIDRERRPGRIVMTGSSQFSMVKGVSETLAGRIAILNLLPFQSSEVPEVPWAERERLGSYPELVLRSHEGAADWFDAYIETYLERDLRSMLAVEKLRNFRTVLGILAARTGQELNLSAVAREAGVTEKTVDSWVSVLEASFIVFLLRPYHRNLGKRLVKRPKLYFWDTGLACRLTGVVGPDSLHKGPLSGPMFENFVLSEIAKDIAHRGDGRGLYFFRSNAGIEADFILEDSKERRLVFGEVKRRQTPVPDDFRRLGILAAASEAERGSEWSMVQVAVNSGSVVERFGERRLAWGIGCLGSGRIDFAPRDPGG